MRKESFAPHRSSSLATSALQPRREIGRMKEERRLPRPSPTELQEGRGSTLPAAWPNLFIVGAVKSGTTSLHRYLEQHPQIYMSSVKEPYFFSVTPPGHQVFDESSYLALFADASVETIRGESSPLYLWDASTPQRIRRVSPNAKIVIMLRDPVERAFSHYLMDVEQGGQTRSFLEAIQLELDRPFHLYVELGRYCHQVSRYLELFDDVLVLFSEEFFADARVQVNEVFRFLGVAGEHAHSVDLSVHNAYEGTVNVLGKAAQQVYRGDVIRAVARRLVPGSARAYVWRSFLRQKKPGIDAEAERLLNHTYRHETNCLRKLLGREVPWKQTHS
jgi:sulfotransferase family protein